MVKFLDGPAAGVCLLLARAPLFLRVVSSSAGGVASWDALDRLEDEPEAGEAVHVYRRVGAAGVAHVDYTDRRGRRRGAWHALAEYRLHAAGPGEAALRDAAAWRAWCLAERAREKEVPGGA